MSQGVRAACGLITEEPQVDKWRSRIPVLHPRRGTQNCYCTEATPRGCRMHCSFLCLSPRGCSLRTRKKKTNTFIVFLDVCLCPCWLWIFFRMIKFVFSAPLTELCVQATGTLFHSQNFLYQFCLPHQVPLQTTLMTYECR